MNMMMIVMMNHDDYDDDHHNHFQSAPAVQDGQVLRWNLWGATSEGRNRRIHFLSQYFIARNSLVYSLYIAIYPIIRNKSFFWQNIEDEYLFLSQNLITRNLRAKVFQEPLPDFPLEPGTTLPPPSRWKALQHHFTITITYTTSPPTPFHHHHH